MTIEQSERSYHNYPARTRTIGNARQVSHYESQCMYDKKISFHMLCTIIIIIYTDYGTVSANISYLLHQIFLCMYVVISFHVFTDTKHLPEIYILRMIVGFKYTHAYFVLKWEIIIFMRLSFYLEQNFSAVTETPRTI